MPFIPNLSYQPSSLFYPSLLYPAVGRLIIPMVSSMLPSQVSYMWVWPKRCWQETGRCEVFSRPPTPYFRLKFLRVPPFLHYFHVGSTSPSQAFLTLVTFISLFIPNISLVGILMAPYCCQSLVASLSLVCSTHITASSPSTEIFLFEPFVMNSVSSGDFE